MPMPVQFNAQLLHRRLDPHHKSPAPDQDSHWSSWVDSLDEEDARTYRHHFERTLISTEPQAARPVDARKYLAGYLGNLERQVSDWIVRNPIAVLALFLVARVSAEDRGSQPGASAWLSRLERVWLRFPRLHKEPFPVWQLRALSLAEPSMQAIAVKYLESEVRGFLGICIRHPTAQPSARQILQFLNGVATDAGRSPEELLGLGNLVDQLRSAVRAAAQEHRESCEDAEVALAQLIVTLPVDLRMKFDSVLNQLQDAIEGVARERAAAARVREQGRQIRLDFSRWFSGPEEAFLNNWD
jgi:hypothetical protein